MPVVLFFIFHKQVHKRDEGEENELEERDAKKAKVAKRSFGVG